MQCNKARPADKLAIPKKEQHSTHPAAPAGQQSGRRTSRRRAAPPPVPRWRRRRHLPPPRREGPAAAPARRPPPMLPSSCASGAAPGLSGAKWAHTGVASRVGGGAAAAAAAVPASAAATDRCDACQRLCSACRAFYAAAAGGGLPQRASRCEHPAEGLRGRFQVRSVTSDLFTHLLALPQARDRRPCRRPRCQKPRERSGALGRLLVLLGGGNRVASSARRGSRALCMGPPAFFLAGRQANCEPLARPALSATCPHLQASPKEASESGQRWAGHARPVGAASRACGLLQLHSIA